MRTHVPAHRADLPDRLSRALAPDGSAVAWQEPDGVWILTRPLDCDTQPALVLPGASTPGWTGAAMQTTRPTYPTGTAPLPTLTVSKKAAVAGVAKVGKKLTARPATWARPVSDLRYQWLRDGKAIKRATKKTYKLTKKDRGHRIGVRVTGTCAGYAAPTSTSRPVRVR